VVRRRVWRRLQVDHEKWFGKSTKCGGMDKLGHLGFSYAMRWFASALKATGNGDASARNLSAISVLATMTAIRSARRLLAEMEFQSGCVDEW
jgi:hypothetical protein